VPLASEASAELARTITPSSTRAAVAPPEAEVGSSSDAALDEPAACAGVMTAATSNAPWFTTICWVGAGALVLAN